MKKNSNNKDWMAAFVNPAEKQPIEAFSGEAERKQQGSIEVIDFQAAYVLNKRSAKTKPKKAILLRLDADLAETVKDYAKSIPQNDVLCALIEYAINDLETRNKTILNK